MELRAAFSRAMWRKGSRLHRRFSCTNQPQATSFWLFWSGSAPPTFFCRRFYFSFAYAKHAFSYWWGPGNTEFLGPEMRLETGFDVMEMVANSSSDRRQVGRQKDPQRSSVTHGSKPSHFRLRVTRRDQQELLIESSLPPPERQRYPGNRRRSETGSCRPRRRERAPARNRDRIARYGC